MTSLPDPPPLTSPPWTWLGEPRPPSSPPPPPRTFFQGQGWEAKHGEGRREQKTPKESERSCTDPVPLHPTFRFSPSHHGVFVAEIGCNF